MPTAAPTRPLGKTGFIKEFLNDHPEANARAVTEAWAAAGFEGTISHSLVSRMRSEMGLTGHLRKRPAEEAEEKSGTTSAPATREGGRPRGATGRLRGTRPGRARAEANGTIAGLGSPQQRSARGGGPAMATGRGGNQGKTPFVIERLRRNPAATDEEINGAWVSSGNEGGISGSLIYKIRAREGLTGGRGAKVRGAGEKGRTTSPKAVRAASAAEPVVGTPKPLDRRTNQGRIIGEVEGDIDRLIFKLMGVGGMEEIEDELRKVRRRLYQSTQG